VDQVTPSMIVLVLAALAVAGGLLLILRALADTPGQAEQGFGPSRLEIWHSYLHDRVLWRRAGIALGAGVVAGLFTGWPVAAILAAAGCWFLPALIGRDTTAKVEIARIEAIATWAEMLRDTLSAAAGLEQSILATASASPAPIREEVAALAAAIGGGARLEDGLKVFAQDLHDPTADMIVAALILSSRQQSRNLAESLGELASSCRAQAALRMRTAADRARHRTTVRMIVGTVLAIAVGLILLNRSYLAPYDTPAGQLVLLMVAGLFGAGTMWLGKISRGKAPTRFFTRLDAAPEPGQNRGLS